MAKKSSREQIALECSECKNRNYHSQKNKLKTTERLVLRKYCRHCRKVTPHKESK